MKNGLFGSNGEDASGKLCMGSVEMKLDIQVVVRRNERLQQ